MIDNSYHFSFFQFITAMISQHYKKERYFFLGNFSFLFSFSQDCGERSWSPHTLDSMQLAVRIAYLIRHDDVTVTHCDRHLSQLVTERVRRESVVCLLPAWEEHTYFYFLYLRWTWTLIYVWSTSMTRLWVGRTQKTNLVPTSPTLGCNGALLYVR